MNLLENNILSEKIPSLSEDSGHDEAGLNELRASIIQLRDTSAAGDRYPCCA